MCAQNREILTPPPLSVKCPYWLNTLSPLTVRTHRKFQKIRSYAPKSADFENEESLSYPHWANPSFLTADEFYGQPLILFKVQL